MSRLSRPALPKPQAAPARTVTNAATACAYFSGPAAALRSLPLPRPLPRRRGGREEPPASASPHSSGNSSQLCQSAQWRLAEASRRGRLPADLQSVAQCRAVHVTLPRSSPGPVEQFRGRRRDVRPGYSTDRLVLAAGSSSECYRWSFRLLKATRRATRKAVAEANTSAACPPSFVDIPAAPCVMNPARPSCPGAPVSVWPREESLAQGPGRQASRRRTAASRPRPGNEDVVRLDVAVNDALGVSCGQASVLAPMQMSRAVASSSCVALLCAAPRVVRLPTALTIRSPGREGPPSITSLDMYQMRGPTRAAMRASRRNPLDHLGMLFGQVHGKHLDRNFVLQQQPDAVSHRADRLAQLGQQRGPAQRRNAVARELLRGAVRTEVRQRDRQVSPTAPSPRQLRAADLPLDRGPRAWLRAGQRGDTSLCGPSPELQWDSGPAHVLVNSNVRRATK